MTKAARDIVVFDLGGVLIDWDPRHLYRKLFAGDEAAMEHFLATVCTHEWNRGQDAGRTFAEGAHLLKAEHPDKAELIDAYGARFDEMMPGPIAGSVEILAELKALGAPLYDQFLGRDLPADFRALRVFTLVSRRSGLR
jgi:2-haloacid dehalogenase